MYRILVFLEFVLSLVIGNLVQFSSQIRFDLYCDSSFRFNLKKKINRSLPLEDESKIDVPKIPDTWVDVMYPRLRKSVDGIVVHFLNFSIKKRSKNCLKIFFIFFTILNFLNFPKFSILFFVSKKDG